MEEELPDRLSATREGGALDFDAVYVRYAPHVRRLLARRGVRAADLDDVTQEMFATVHRLLPTFEGRSSIETWLHAIAWRFSATYRRRPHIRHEHGPSNAEPATDGVAQHLDDSFDDKWDRIDADQRDLLALHHVGGFSIAQLSALTGHARATISKRIAQAQAKLARQRGPREAAADSPPPAPLSPLSPLVQDGSVRVMSCRQICLSSVDDLVIGIWRGPCTMESLHALEEAFVAALAQRPDGIRYLAIVEPTSSPPDLEGRKFHAHMARTYGPRMRAAADAVEASSMMWLVSGLMNAYFAVARTPVNMRFFGDVPAAIAWLTPYGSTAPGRILAHVTLMRAQLDPPIKR